MNNKQIIKRKLQLASINK